MGLNHNETEPNNVEKRNKAIALAVLKRILRNADQDYLEALIEELTKDHPDWLD